MPDLAICIVGCEHHAQTGALYTSGCDVLICRIAFLEEVCVLHEQLKKSCFSQRGGQHIKNVRTRQ